MNDSSHIAQLPTEESGDLQLPSGNSGSGSRPGYQVQARCVGHEPELVCGQLLDQRWKTLRFEKSPIGVPAYRAWDWHLQASDCMNYEAAQALRWWFLAETANNRLAGRICIETRIVAFKIQYSHQSVAGSVLEENKDEWRKATL